MHPEPQPPIQRRWRRWIAAALTATALVAGACAGPSGSGAPATTPSSTSAQATTTTAVALEQPSSRCGPPDTPATLVGFTAADGTSLDGVLVGRGRAGVVLVHEYPADLCGFWPFANYLAKRGLRAFAIDLRCFGRSACPQGDAKGRVVDDIAAAVAELHRRGVTRVALVGASMGGAAVLIAATRVRPPVAAVVSLSGEADPTNLVGGIPLDAGAAVKRLKVPAMLVVATGDRYAPVGETRAMYRAVTARDKELLVLSGPSFDGRHGWDLVTAAAAGQPTSVAAKVAAFLTAHSDR
jgi:dienelactone hydrolase